ncbi:uncharacterized protein LOC126967289 isoform X1 [Leptidea sinapis]|uniref:uncharacterized protein LOC126967289 isoform X1 n=1 Tax=Leptidea sinapis TaxID=189913 RepID=UPI00213414C7|nr:uncharacterized protein LOC126967289 isoform X1 [Leptidea sinapis]
MAISPNNKFDATPITLKATDLNSGSRNKTRFTKYCASSNESEASVMSNYSIKELKNSVSPYLAKNRITVKSKVTEKKIIQEQSSGFVSSFPLAVSLYKANSDEKVPRRSYKKPKKAMPKDISEPLQICNVSDMNESDYNESRSTRKPRPKKRKVNQNKNLTLPNESIEIYGRNSKYCSQMNIHLKGDGNFSRKSRRNNITIKDDKAPSNVWAMLRNINRFQFIPSAPVSLESLVPMKTSKNTKSNRNAKKCKDARLIKSCRTEEFAYISISSYSGSSSCDRVTVVDKQDHYNDEYIKGIENVEITQKSLTDDFKQSINQFETSNGIEQTKYKTNQETPYPEKIRYVAHENQKEYVDRPPVAKKIILKNNDCSDHLEQGDTGDVGDKSESDNIVSKKLSKTSVAGSKDRNYGLINMTTNSKLNVIQPKTRHPRLATTMPAARISPKLTQTDIKRKLCNLRFPIVILGNDEISSRVEIINDQYSQFMGLDNQIWPYMVKWLPQKENRSDGKHIAIEHNAVNKHKISVNNSDSIHQKSSLHEAFKTANYSSKRNNPKHVTSHVDVTNKPKYAQTQHVKEVLNSFNTKAPDKTRTIRATSVYTVNGGKIFQRWPPGVTIETQTDTKNSETKFNVNQEKIATISKKTPMLFQWSKVKWASDLIENVITKIKNGTYYDHEFPREKRIIDMQNKSTQTETKIKVDNNNYITPLHETKVYFEDDLKTIPGFDCDVAVIAGGLEVETINKQQIAVRNCVANIVVQFDVKLPFNIVPKTSLIKESSMSLIPLLDRESKTKVFKYKASLTNNILPAELCRIFPNILRNIFKTNMFPHLPKITNSAAYDVVASEPYPDTCEFSVLNNTLSSIAVRIVNGRFSNVLPKQTRHIIERKNFFAHKKTELLVNYKLQSPILLDVLSLYHVNINYIRDSLKIFAFPKPSNVLILDQVKSQASNNKCRALVPYCTAASYQDYIAENLTAAFGTQDTDVKLISIKPAQRNGLFDMIKWFDIKLFGNKINSGDHYINKNVFHENGVLDLNKNVFNNPKTNKTRHAIAFGNKQNNKGSTSYNKVEEHETIKMLKPKNFNIHRKQGCVKFCRKCKSTTCITRYKSVSLKKIANLDEFFQAIGLAKDLSCIINGNVEKNILSAIIEMKAWLTEISPRQALLIFLLANKKETPITARHRNVIIQGIASNRITQASDLDMELEVIERESLSNLNLCEGRTYLPKNNEDVLLEELCWIAKSTAAENHRIFDQSSIELLRSLLQKRRKLNPTYLRVMAKYAGLGLLKAK